jgi:hypothetical protein
MLATVRTAVANLVSQFRSDRTSVLVLAYLVVLDLVFILIHIVRGVMKERGRDIGFLADPHFSLLQDNGFGEWYNYAKMTVVCVLLFYLWKRREQLIYLVLAFIFLAVLIDDSLTVHETGGHLLLDWVGRDTRLGIHVRDLGELATWAMLGSAALAFFVYAYRRSPPEDATVAAYFAACLVALTGFAIGVDMVHAIAPTRALDGLFGIIEEAGELLVMSLTCALALLFFRMDSRPVAVLARERDRVAKTAGGIAHGNSPRRSL